MQLAARASDRDNNYDCLRFLAASSVIWSHSYTLTAGQEADPITPHNFFGIGGLAVLIFFSISGFLITKSWRDDPHLGSFAFKRVLRIGPALAAATLLAVFVIGPLVTTWSLKDYFASRETALYLRNATCMRMAYSLPGVFENLPYHSHTEPPRGVVNGSLWSLPGEATMYILVACCGVLGVWRYRPLVLVQLGLLLFVEWHLSDRVDSSYADLSALLNQSPGPVRPLRYLLAVFADAWSLDCVRCYEYFLAGAAYYLYAEYVTLRGGVCLGLLGLYALALDTPFIFLATLLAVPYITFYLAYQRRLNASRFGKYGDFSYGVYVYAFPIQQLLLFYFQPRLTTWTLMAVSFPLTLAVAVLSWRFIEKPAMKLKRLVRSPTRLKGIHSPLKGDKVTSEDDQVTR